jgi:hypothetical protein
MWCISVDLLAQAHTRVQRSQRDGVTTALDHLQQPAEQQQQQCGS